MREALECHASRLRSLHLQGRRAAATQLAALEARLPIILDLIEDKAKHRHFTLALYALVFVYVLRASVFILFLNHQNLLPTQPPVPQLRLLKPLPASLEIGATLRPFLSVGVSDGAGRALAAQAVTVTLELDDAPSVILTQQYGYSGTALDESGLLLGTVFGLPGFPPRPLQAPATAGATATSDDTGTATFRSLCALTALPASYLVVAQAGSGARATLGRVRLTSSVASVELLPAQPGGPLRVPLGGRLPELRLRVLDGQGFPLPGKTAVLLSAPPEASEFSSLLASADLLQPRAALLGGATSSRTGLDGFAAFGNATLTGSSLQRVRLWAVVDGVVARVAGSGEAAVALRVEAPAGGPLLLSLRQAPSRAVLEGQALAVQPSVLVERVAEGGARVPVPGVTVFAYALSQAGYRSQRTPLGPAGVAELSAVAGTLDAVLGNLGRTKALFGAASSPSNASGVASFAGLGFIRHGPAGSYTLGFAAAGLSSLESPPIDVASSVASVTWDYGGNWPDAIDCFDEWDHYTGVAHERLEGTCTLAATVCNWPACLSTLGTNSGFAQYNSRQSKDDFNLYNDLLADDGSNLFEDYLRASPSGVLSGPSVLQVRDAAGRPLAGKAAAPRAAPLGGAAPVELQEFPFAGAAVSKLRVPAYMTAYDGSDALLVKERAQYNAESGGLGEGYSKVDPYVGALTYMRINIPLLLERGKADVRNAYAAEVNDGGSFLRVVTAPPGESAHDLTFDVEGVSTRESIRLRVLNLDARSDTIPLPPIAPPASTLCAHLRLLEAPALLLQDGSTAPIVKGARAAPLPFRSADGSPSAGFAVQAVTSAGAPLANLSISMFVVDALGYTMYTTTGGEHLGLRSGYAYSLRSMGGVGAHTLGNRTLSPLGSWLHGPAALATTGADGVARFPALTLRRSQNTWMRFGFAAQYNDLAAAWYGLPPTAADYLPRHASCISEYSSAVVIDSTVQSCQWVDAGGQPLPAGGDRQQVYEAVDALSSPVRATLDALPVLQVSGPAGNVPPAVLYSVIDGSLEAFPAHVGVHTFKFESLPSLEVQQLAAQIGESITPADGYLSIYTLDGMQVGAFNPAIDAVLGTVTSALISPTGLANPYAIPDNAAPNGSAPFLAHFERYETFPGRIGNYSIAAFCGGEVSESLRMSFRDGIDTVVAADWSPGTNGACPGAHTLSYLGNPLEILPAQPHPCPNNCSGHGQCLCGVCVCAGGWDGAFDCSAPFLGDAWGLAFSLDPLYSDLYGGLAVYDVRRGMELGGMPGYLGDVFPRVLLPQLVAVGAAAAPGGATAVEATLRSLAAASADSGGSASPADPALRLLDAADAVRRAALLPGLAPAAPAPALQALAGLGGSVLALLDVQLAANKSIGNYFYKAMPVLVTCDGQEASGWSWVSGLTACASDPVPVSSDPFQGFDRYAADFSLPDATLPPNASDVFLERRFDRRLHLHNVPTGCYRFKLAYGAQGPGRRLERSIDRPLASAQGASLGLGRPFRVLSPVESIREAPPRWLAPPAVPDSLNVTVLRGARFPFAPSVALAVRPRAPVDPDVSLPSPRLTDGCSDGVDFQAFIYYNLPNSAPRYRDLPLDVRPPRCPISPPGGLDVTVTAVSVASGLQYSLYVAGQSADCARTSGVDSSYSASFEGLAFPELPAQAPGASSEVLNLPPPPGAYRLRFQSYGTHTLSSYTVTLVDLPSQIASLLDLRALVPEPTAAASGSSNSSSGTPPPQPPPVLPRLLTPRGFFPFSVAVATPVTVGSEPQDSDALSVVAVGSALFPPALLQSIDASALIYNWFPLELVAASPLALSLDRQVMSALHSILPPDADVAFTPVQEALVTTELLYGPPRSNARLRSSTSRVAAGLAEPDLFLLSAAPGLYVVQHSTALGVGSASGGALQVLNVTSPLAAVTLRVPKAQGKLVSGAALPGEVRVCALLANSSDARAGAGLPVVLRAVLLPAAGGAPEDGARAPGAPAWLRAARGAAGHAMVRVGSDELVDVEVGARFASSSSSGSGGSGGSSLAGAALTLGSDGCLSLAGLSFSVPQTTSFALLASVLGVEAPLAKLYVTSLADANPVSLDKIKKRIAAPLLVILPLLAFNSPSLPAPLRACAGLGAVVAVCVLGASDGVGFEEEAAGLTGAWSAYDLSYLAALNGVWWLVLALAAAHTAVLLVGMAPELALLAAAGVQAWRERGADASACVSACASVCSSQAAGAAAATAGAAEEAQPQRFRSLFFHDHGALRLSAAQRYVKSRLPRLHAPAPAKLAAEQHGKHSEGEDHHHSSSGGHHGSHHDANHDPHHHAETPWSPAAAALRALRDARAALHACVFLEDEALAFFFPQRLLLAALVSAVFCGMVFMLLLYWCVILKEALQQGLADALRAASSALVAVLYTRLRGGDAQANAVSAALQWEAAFSPTLASCAEKLARVLSVVQDATDGGSGGPAVPLPPSFQAAVAAAAAAGEGGSGGGTPEDFIDFLRKQAVSSLEPWAASLALRLQDCSIAGASLALLYIGASWWALLVQYKATVLGLRRGVGRESGLGPAVHGGHDTPSKAVGFVGVQAAGSALALLLCAAAFTALLFALTTAWVQAWLRSFFADVLVVLLSTGFLIRVLKFLLFEMTMTADGSIHLRRAFSGLEVYFGFVSVISGVILAVARLPLAFASFLGTLMRPDVHVSAFNLRLDPAVKTYGALLAMDARFSNPYHIVAARLLQDALREARARREAAAAAAAAATGAACRLGEDGVVVAVSNPLAEWGSGEGKEARSEQAAREAAQSSAVRRRMLARNRWWLALVLLAHPQLAQYRVRGLVHEHEPHEHGVGETVYHYAAGILC